ncbi:MAG: DUF4386 domain-containing protein [Chloroflexi bacterium]|nr:DUF4386 domain-containing protein [Chloroflexota bacterium]
MFTSKAEIAGFRWNGLYKIGGAAALLCAGMYFVTMGIYIPAYRVAAPPATVLEWFALFQAKALTGLFFLGLADVMISLLWCPLSLALYAILKQSDQAWATIATAFAFVGIAFFLATNTAWAMLYLSREYAAATSEAQRSTLLSAGQAMVAVTEGARMLPLIPLAGLILSTVMLRNKMFGKATAWVGILGLGLLAASGFFAGYATTGPTTAVVSVLTGVTYAGGGLLSLAWYFLVGLRLLKLGQRKVSPLSQPSTPGIGE